MKLAPLSCALVLCSIIGIMDTVRATVSADYPGVIELVGFSNRRARTHYIPPDESQQQSKIKMAADIETVKQNIKKYNSLLKVDTKNLPESQKDILERIVERVARLKESLDISQDQDNSTNSNESLTETTESQETTISSRQMMTSSEMADSSSFSASSSIEDTTTKNPDSTTTDDDQLMMSTADEEDYSMTNQDVKIDDDFAAKELPDDELALVDEANTDVDAATSDLDEDGEIPTSTIGSDEMDDDQFVAARSNNNNHRTLVSTSNTIGKTKSRPISTKRPGSSLSTKSSSSTLSIKRVNGQKPASMVGSASKSTTSYSVGSTTTVQPIVKIQKPLVQQKEPETMMKVQHQLPQKQQQQQQLNKLQNYQQEQDAASTSPAIQQQQQQIEQKTVSPVQQTVQIQQRTPILGGGGISSSGSTNTAASSLGSDVLYDANVNASSIIDSLNNAREEFYNKGGVNNKDKKPSATAKPTKYHYYPHNQHIYLLPECAIQQVCNAVYVRLNYTQPLCACPSRYRDPCSASLNEDDQHTTKLVGDGKKKAITLAKTCEATTEMRECRSPKDWSLLALQNTRTGKSHYLVICRCPDHFKMEGPMAHDQPTYASVPGIRVFGMMCVKPGYSVRKPSAQPPKRYQLQKPYYIPSSQNKYSSIKDHSRPSYTSSSSSSSSSLGGASSLNYQPQHHHNLHQQDNFQSQHQANYQYLNRPDSSSSHFISSSNSHNNHNNHNDFPESISFSGSVYGRNNERNGEKPITAAEEDSTSTSLSSSSSSSSSSSGSPSSSSSSPITSATKPEEISRTTADIDAATSTLDAASKRDKRSIRELNTEEDSTPEFPWQRAIEFQRSIVWD